MPCTLFVSDLHLDPERPAITALFLDFLATRGGEAEALYILGDLFEAWVGDDDDAELNQAVCRAIADCAASGTAVHLMHGNRDFLIGERFARQAHCTLLPDPARIELYGTPTLLMHGDLLCTDDTEYQAFRSQARSTAWQADLLNKTLAERRVIASDMRRVSREKTGGKPESIMDVNTDAVIARMREHGVTRLIHGHTHRPGVHDLIVDGRPAQRLVLGDWYGQGSVLECTATGCELQVLELQGLTGGFP
ncbi:MAG: UDP-2,3-diacylglucosamine diphosphatase [Gammaproteobacteria bacterium]|jgi:UDP-2,3-diacylglucosamine hydrolase